MAVSFSALPTEMGLQTLLLMTATITDGLMKPILSLTNFWSGQKTPPEMISSAPLEKPVLVRFILVTPIRNFH